MAKVRRVTHRSATSSPRSSRTRASLSQSIGDVSPAGDFVGPWYAWWPGDPLPALPPLPGLSAAPADDDRALTALARLGVEEVALSRAPRRGAGRARVVDRGRGGDRRTRARLRAPARRAVFVGLRDRGAVAWARHLPAPPPGGPAP